jgi:hypothetical protein
MGPFTANCGDGYDRSFSYMIDGRPADTHYWTMFFAPGTSRNLESLNELTQVGGM